MLLLLLAIGALRFDHFLTPANLSNLPADYAFVTIAAVGATFVILSGGIDLSVGSLVAFTAVLAAHLIAAGWHPLAAAGVCLLIGTTLGAAMGGLIVAFDLPPFMVTLAGMFGLRAAAFLVRDQSVGVSHPFLAALARDGVLRLPGGFEAPPRSTLMLAVLLAGWALAARTRFGRGVYALGGHERSARMMGVPIGFTKVRVYALAGACSTLAGIVLMFDTRSGNPAAGAGLELAVIASVVVGGTLLSGGVGSVLGTLIGVLILGAIRMLIDFEGTLSAAWTSIATGVLLLTFVALQRALIVWAGWRAQAAAASGTWTRRVEV
ncbi:MAG: sugar ABC transporter permease YjfF [Phycisphaerae bacterium]|nr:sugar ABC transporter permease YjfF [Phycisphaerae bacterium]